MGGWLDTDNRAISVQLNLTGTATGTELGNINGDCVQNLRLLGPILFILTGVCWWVGEEVGVIGRVGLGRWVGGDNQSLGYLSLIN